MENTGSPAHSRGLMRPIGWLFGTTEHHNILIRALHNVLTVPLARNTLGQIVGGFILYGAFFGDTRAAEGQCSQLNADVLLKQGQLRAMVDIRTLRVDAAVLSAFSEAEIGSVNFQQRLIELVARAVHAMAIVLFQEVVKDADTTWRPDFHPWYSDFELYPDGEADGVGYWAEDRILGGVVLFERREVDNSGAVYLHPGSERTATTPERTASRIHQLTDSQRQALLDYLSGVATPAVPDPSTTFIPIRCDGDDNSGIDPMEATTIYRDAWDRAGLTRAE